MASEFVYLLVALFELNSKIIFSLVPILYCDVSVGILGI